MMYQLIRSFAYENFGSDYHVAPQGHNKAIQPLALIAKENLSCWRRATRRPKKIVLEGLEAYLTNDESVRSNVIPMIESCLQKDEILTVRSDVSVTTTRKIDLEMGEGITGHADRNTVLGELNLSSVQEEYYKDMSLRSILSNAKLDPAKMEPYEKNKLYIITGVVYSEKMEIDGKREERNELGAQVRLPRWNWFSKLARLKADMSRTQHPAPPIERSERSPLLFTFAKVKYNQENRCLELQQLVGTKMKRKGTLDVVADSVADSLCFGDEIEIMVTTKEQWIYEDLMEISENKTETKLKVILGFLEESETLQEMILRARNYKNLVDRITKTNNMAIQIESPLSAKDSDLLQATGVEIKYHILNNAKTLRISAHNRAMVLDFAQIFYHLQGVQEEEWRLLKEFCGNPKEMEDGKYSRKNDSGDDEGREEKEAKKCNDIIKNGGIIKKDMSTEEHTRNGDKRWNENTDEKEDMCKDKHLNQEDKRNGVNVKEENEEKEDIDQEERLSGKDPCKEVKTENKDTDEKAEDICKNKLLAQEDVRNEVTVEDKDEKKEDIDQEERLSQEGPSKELKTENIDIDGKEGDICIEQLAQEDKTNGVTVDDKNEEKEDIDQEERLSQEGPSKEVKTENIDIDEKEGDIYTEEQLAQEDKTNGAKKGNATTRKENETLINEEQEKE